MWAYHYPFIYGPPWVECDLNMILTILVTCLTSFSSVSTEGLFYSLFLILKYNCIGYINQSPLKALLAEQLKYWVRGKLIGGFLFFFFLSVLLFVSRPSQ